jgi:hypothetical protein
MNSISRFFRKLWHRPVTRRTPSATLAVESLEERSLFNVAPVLGALPNQTMTAGQGSLVVPLPLSDADGDKIKVDLWARKTASLPYQLDQQYNLNSNGNYHYNQRGSKEKYITGKGGWFFITPSGDLYRFVKNIPSSEFVASVGKSAYANPKLLWQATPPGVAPVKLSLDANKNIVVTPTNNFVGTFLVGVRGSDGPHKVGRLRGDRHASDGDHR